MLINKLVSSHLITLATTVLVVFYISYFHLLQDSFLNISIASVITYSHQFEIKQHLLILGLLPVYIAAMIFGAASLGLYLGSLLQQGSVKLLKRYISRATPIA